LLRSGTNLSGYISTNGANWTAAGNIGLGGLGSTGYWGLAVTAHNNSTRSFAVIDNAAFHSPLSISVVPDQSTILGLPLPAIAFTVGSATVPADSLAVMAASTNSTLLPVSSISLGGADSNRTVNLEPAHGRIGASQVTLTASDGAYNASTAFIFTVNSPPQLNI